MPETPNPHAHYLDELITMGMDLARAIHADAMAASTPNPAQVAAFDRVSRTVRRTVLLARKLAEAPSLETRRTHARARVIREVEDAINRDHGDTEHAETLRAELAERLEAPDLDDNLDLRPLPEVISEIRHDLGLDAAPGTRPWRRRTPADLRDLRRRAAPTSVPTPGRTRLHPLSPSLRQPGAPWPPPTLCDPPASPGAEPRNCHQPVTEPIMNSP